MVEWASLGSLGATPVTCTVVVLAGLLLTVVRPAIACPSHPGVNKAGIIVVALGRPPGPLGGSAHNFVGRVATWDSPEETCIRQPP